MFIGRTPLSGALVWVLVVLVLSLTAGAVFAQGQGSIEKQLDDIRAGIPKIEQQPVDDRQDPLSELEKRLKRIKVTQGTEMAHYKDFLLGRIMEARQDDASKGQIHTAASQYRKLITKAGHGLIEGNPPGGRWPDPYVEEAYTRYKGLTAEIQQANSKKTMYKIVDVLVKMTGSRENYSFWLAIVVVTLLVKLITTPFSHLQFESMRNLQRIQPRLDKLRKELADDQQELQRQQWQLMKDHNASPHWGCLALLVQMPFLLLIYHTIRAYEFQFAQGDFLWIGSALASKVPWVGQSLADPDWPLLILYGVSMYVSTKMSSPAVDKQQADQQKMMAIMMPAIFVLFFNSFPSAFILYWLVLNVLTTTQQYFMLQKPVPALALEDDNEPGVPQPASAVSAARGPSGGKRR